VVEFCKKLANPARVARERSAQNDGGGRLISGEYQYPRTGGKSLCVALGIPCGQMGENQEGRRWGGSRGAKVGGGLAGWSGLGWLGGIAPPPLGQPRLSINDNPPCRARTSQPVPEWHDLCQPPSPPSS
jgi:hypothetical protein